MFHGIRWPLAGVSQGRHLENSGSDTPIVILGTMGEKDGLRYYQSGDGTGIPENELEFIG